MTQEKLDKHKLHLWIFIISALVIGLAMNVIIGLQQKTTGNFAGIGIILLIALSMLCGGGLLGFLFAIPRINYNSFELDPGFRDSNIENAKTTKKRVVFQNDNLVQISDWITKIIVGVGLTQLNNIPAFLVRAGKFLGTSFSSSESFGTNAAIATILYYSIMGFLAFYLWTRMYYVHFVDEAEQTVGKENKGAAEK